MLQTMLTGLESLAGDIGRQPCKAIGKAYGVKLWRTLTTVHSIYLPDANTTKASFTKQCMWLPLLIFCVILAKV